MLEQRFYTANSQDSTQRTVKTLHSEQLQSTRDCGSINISKRGKSQERRLYTANSSSLQETVRASTSPREVRKKKEDSTQQPKLSLQETAEARTSPKETRKKILHSSQSSVDNRQSSSKHQASRLQQNLNFRHQSRGVQRRPVGISSSPSARAEECSGGQWGPPPSPGAASRSRGPSWSRSGSCRGSPSEAAENKAADFKTLKTLKNS